MVSVTVSGPNGVSAPTGSVTVTDATGSCSINALDAGTGACSLVENYSENGKPVTASYQETPTTRLASGTTQENVSLGTPTVSVSAPTSAVTGTIYYDVTISGQGAAPSGTVTIADGTKTGTGAPNQCTGALVGGVASCPLAEVTGKYQITATYSGDPNYATAVATVTEIVNETSTALVVSTNTLRYGLEQTATFTVTVYPPIGYPTAPTGTTVQLMAGPQTLCVTSPLTPSSVVVGLNPLGVPVSAEVGTATCQLAPAALAAGSYTVAAEFPGQPGVFRWLDVDPGTACSAERAHHNGSLAIENDDNVRKREQRDRDRQGRRAQCGLIVRLWERSHPQCRPGHMQRHPQPGRSHLQADPGTAAGRAPWDRGGLSRYDEPHSVRVDARDDERGKGSYDKHSLGFLGHNHHRQRKESEANRERYGARRNAARDRPGRHDGRVYEAVRSLSSSWQGNMLARRERARRRSLFDLCPLQRIDRARSLDFA